MSEENVELVRRNFELFNELGRTGDDLLDPEEFAPETWARLSPDFELHERSDLPDGGVYRGPDEAKEFWFKIQQIFSEVRWEAREFIDLGHAVFVETMLTATGRGSEVPTATPEYAVFWFRDDMLVKLAGYPTKEEALLAAAEPVT